MLPRTINTMASTFGRAKRVKSVAILALVVAVVVFPLVQSPYRVFQGSMVGVYVVAIAGLALIIGAAGQVTLGHSFFFAAGAFTSAWLIDEHGFNDLAAVPVAAVIALVLGWIFGIPALRLRGLYLTIVTLSLAVAVPPLARRFESFTGGVGGRIIGPVEPPGWTGLASDQWVFFQVSAVASLVLIATYLVLRSPFGRAMRAVRDNEIAAAAGGIDVAKVKVRAFAAASMAAGIGGALYTMTVRFVAPDSFTMLLSIMMLAALVVGGLRSLLGVVLAAVFLQYVPAWAGSVNQALSGLTFGVLLILLVTFLPLGLSGAVAALWNRITTSRRGDNSNPHRHDTDRTMSASMVVNEAQTTK